MEIFISWSGNRSKIVAEALHDWIPYVIQSAKPWVSSKDIYAGDRWSKEISNKLENTKFGIICLTPENMNEPWIHFEVGALAKTLNKTYVCPYLINLNPSDIKGPLTQFQLVEANKDGTLNIMQSINQVQYDKALDEKRINNTFDQFWPNLDKKLNDLHQPDNNRVPIRKEREILEEILETVRGLRYSEEKFIKGEFDLFPEYYGPKYISLSSENIPSVEKAVKEFRKELETIVDKTKIRTREIKEEEKQ